MEMEELSGREMAELAAFADGSRDDPALAARIAASPRLQALVAEQRVALAAIRAARPEAPQRLRVALGTRPRARRRRGGVLSFGLATAGVVGLAIVALLPGASAPTVAQAAALASRGPIQAAPPRDPARPGALSRNVDGVRYPYWEDTFGWTASGARSDRLDGRSVFTVYYASRTASIGYTIIAGKALPEPRGARSYALEGTRFEALQLAGRTVVTWQRAGHTCVLSATHLPLRTLLDLAGWRDDGSLRS
jgi:hypothetical protein